MTIFAGLFLGVFGACGAWLLAKRYPNARFMRSGYVLMSLGGACFVAWALSKNITVGVAAAIILAAGGTVGAIGALRKELRLDL